MTWNQKAYTLARLLNDVDDAIVRDCGVDSDLTVIRRSFSEDDDSSGEKRQTVFYFDQPATTPVLSGVTVDGSDTGSGSPITGHVLDREKMDQGWVKANGPHESDSRQSAEMAACAHHADTVTNRPRVLRLR